jgi:hypothetical protein
MCSYPRDFPRLLHRYLTASPQDFQRCSRRKSTAFSPLLRRRGLIIGSDEVASAQLFFRTISDVISEDLADAAGEKKGESKAAAA